jgi:hypothetical protein
MRGIVTTKHTKVVEDREETQETFVRFDLIVSSWLTLAAVVTKKL